jgi:predicted dehydrogenase
VNKVKIGILGYGVIASRVYVPGISKMPKAEMVAVCDLIEERARDASARYNIPQVYTNIDDMLAKSGIDLMVNLTHIQAHFGTNLKALQAGKHVYSEKIFAGNPEEATVLIEEAKKHHVKLGAAAATMLSPVNIKIQELLHNGAIGRVNFAIAHHSHCGAADFPNWTTDPSWFYKPGAGPLPDLGVYGLHSLTGLLGPAKSVMAMSGIAMPTRTVSSGPVKGKKVDVEIDDNTLIMLDFGGSTYSFMDSTYTVQSGAYWQRTPTLEIFGSEGTINVNPRGAPCPLSIFHYDAKTGLRGWMDQDIIGAQPWNLSGGVEHLIDCILDPTLPVITTGEHARHVIEIMGKCYEAARKRCTLDLTTTF